MRTLRVSANLDETWDSRPGRRADNTSTKNDYTSARTTSVVRRFREQEASFAADGKVRNAES